MLRLLGIVISIGLADSINPTTVAPALYLAAGKAAVKQVLEFAIGVFAVNLIGGLAITLGPGQLLLHLVPRPRPIVADWLEVVSGAVLMVAALVLRRFRTTLSQRQLFSEGTVQRRSGLLLGAGITAVEFPTAFPFFAAIATVVASSRPIPEEVILIAVYQACFVLPLVGIVAVLWLAPQRSAELLCAARSYIQRHWVAVLVIVLLIAGAFVLTLGATGVAGHVPNRFGNLARHVHHAI